MQALKRVLELVLAMALAGSISAALMLGILTLAPLVGPAPQGETWPPIAAADVWPFFWVCLGILGAYGLARAMVWAVPRIAEGIANVAGFLVGFVVAAVLNVDSVSEYTAWLNRHQIGFSLAVVLVSAAGTGLVLWGGFLVAGLVGFNVALWVKGGLSIATGLALGLWLSQRRI